jgi:crotonobetainyl-CoA:carnitine CoA-transferase CaiB-like acyl-CoA transferase
VSALPLAGLRVVDAATLAAGPLVATALGEFGADVIKVELPATGDPLRTWGPRRDGVGLVWKSVSRNKKCVTLDMRTAEGRELLHRLLAVSDVFVVNTRLSTLARWQLDYESVHERHPRLVVLHVTGYGHGGPASDRPGFGTLAEAMSGFAAVTGAPDGPPTLPPFMLADGVAAQAATYAVMMALYHRDTHGADGQLVDVSLVEPLARLVEQATLAYDQLGVVQPRTGNRVDASAPRNTYRTGDDRWVAVSSAASSTAKAVYRAIERPDLAMRPEYVDPVPRQARSEEIDALVAEWVAQHSFDETMKVFLGEGVAAAPVYDAGALLADEHFRARGTFMSVEDRQLGHVTVQSPVAVLSETPGVVEHLGRELGADNDDVYGGLLGLTADRIEGLRAAGTI